MRIDEPAMLSASSHDGSGPLPGPGPRPPGGAEGHATDSKSTTTGVAGGDRHIALDELSNVAGASRFQFIRLFRASTGLTPMKFLERCRIEFAPKLIREDNRSMHEIALAAGFAAQSYFGKRFRRHAGCTPGQYAAQIRARTGDRPKVRTSWPAASNFPLPESDIAPSDD